MVKRKYYIPRCKGLEGVPWYEACLKLRKHEEIREESVMNIYTDGKRHKSDSFLTRKARDAAADEKKSGGDKVDLLTVKFEITKKSILAKWKCPNCGRVNSEWLYDDPQKTALHCHGCGEHFKGELE